jgi:hypothetical protein
MLTLSKFLWLAAYMFPDSPSAIIFKLVKIWLGSPVSNISAKIEESWILLKKKKNLNIFKKEKCIPRCLISRGNVSGLTMDLSTGNSFFILDESDSRFISESDEHFRITSEDFDDRDFSVLMIQTKKNEEMFVKKKKVVDKEEYNIVASNHHYSVKIAYRVLSNCPMNLKLYLSDLFYIPLKQNWICYSMHHLW